MKLRKKEKTHNEIKQTGQHMARMWYLAGDGRRRREIVCKKLGRSVSRISIQRLHVAEHVLCRAHLTFLQGAREIRLLGGGSAVGGMRQVWPSSGENPTPSTPSADGEGAAPRHWPVGEEEESCARVERGWCTAIAGAHRSCAHESRAWHHCRSIATRRLLTPLQRVASTRSLPMDPCMPDRWPLDGSAGEDGADGRATAASVVGGDGRRWWWRWVHPALMTGIRLRYDRTRLHRGCRAQRMRRCWVEPCRRWGGVGWGSPWSHVLCATVEGAVMCHVEDTTVTAGRH
jgi:hypothetical protein